MKLGLGTAQFGLDYGVSNQAGKTPPTEVTKILEVAALNGVRIIDTAPAYGDSEAVLGKTLLQSQRFEIVTKTPAFSKTVITQDDAQVLQDTFYSSLSNLNQSSIYGLLVHHVDDLLAESGEQLMETMLELKHRELVKKIGVSVYTGEQIDRVLDQYAIDLIQVPINVLDQRLIVNGYLHKLKKEGIEVHARSVFLQGLLLMNPNELHPFFTSVKQHLYEYHSFIQKKGISHIQAALGFIANQNEIDCVLVGVCSHWELIEIQNALDVLQDFRDLSQFIWEDEKILNPSLWKLT